MRPKRVRHIVTQPEPGRFHVLVGGQACILQLLEPRSPGARALQQKKPLNREAPTVRN